VSKNKRHITTESYAGTGDKMKTKYKAMTFKKSKNCTGWDCFEKGDQMEAGQVRKLGITNYYSFEVSPYHKFFDAQDMRDIADFIDQLNKETNNGK